MGQRGAAGGLSTHVRMVQRTSTVYEAGTAQGSLLRGVAVEEGLSVFRAWVKQQEVFSVSDG